MSLAELFTRICVEHVCLCGCPRFLSFPPPINADARAGRSSMLKFTQDHEWLLVNGDAATIGITQHAQEQLGDLVFVELPKPGRSVDAGAAAAVAESVEGPSGPCEAGVGEGGGNNKRGGG